MDKRKQKHKVVRNSELPNEFEQINHQESIINHEEAMLIDSDSRESITINQKDQWTEMEQSIQAALMDSNNNNSVEITQNIDNAGVQGLDVREVDNDMISVNTINIDYGEDSEIGEKNDKKVPNKPAQLTEEAIRKLEEEFYRHDLAIKQIAQDLNIDVSWIQFYHLFRNM
ncbi:hypothetical protein RhiirA1_221953 [Rhizophagus irregularis]|uniref:Uncharacterized protein n=1 Tax=Rhizophagus irregularis TaxID=588596 RepID=A0A2N0SEW0_9GLOM|nr:hypothetical protein RhiirA1_221953 [Rhizophagus irregularis]